MHPLPRAPRGYHLPRYGQTRPAPYPDWVAPWWAEAGRVWRKVPDSDCQCVTPGCLLQPTTASAACHPVPAVPVCLGSAAWRSCTTSTAGCWTYPACPERVVVIHPTHHPGVLSNLNRPSLGVCKIRWSHTHCFHLRSVT